LADRATVVPLLTDVLDCDSNQEPKEQHGSMTAKELVQRQRRQAFYLLLDDCCRRLSLADRATMVPLLAAVVDFDSSQETYEQYDSMTAKELFQK